VTTWLVGGLALAAVVAVVREVRREPTKPPAVTVVLCTAAAFVALWLAFSAGWGVPLGDGLPGLAAVLTLYFLSILVRMARR
jgi:ABC-type Fe3+-siderophore transport system permease subunit